MEVWGGGSAGYLYLMVVRIWALVNVLLFGRIKVLGFSTGKVFGGALVTGVLGFLTYKCWDGLVRRGFGV